MPPPVNEPGLILISGSERSWSRKVWWLTFTCIHLQLLTVAGLGLLRPAFLTWFLAASSAEEQSINWNEAY
jgi:hypothetical protein